MLFRRNGHLLFFSNFLCRIIFLLALIQPLSVSYDENDAEIVSQLRRERGRFTYFSLRGRMPRVFLFILTRVLH